MRDLFRPMPTVELVLQIATKKPPRDCNLRGRDQRKVCSAGNSKGSASRGRVRDSRLSGSGGARCGPDIANLS
jgi:hypothetical protein